MIKHILLAIVAILLAATFGGSASLAVLAVTEGRNGLAGGLGCISGMALAIWVLVFVGSGGSKK